MIFFKCEHGYTRNIYTVFHVPTLMQTWILLHEHFGSFKQNCEPTMSQTENHSPVKLRYNIDLLLAIEEMVTHSWGLNLLDQSVR